jgi:hypothetical protein
MKGHKDSDGTFHPHTPYKGIRKSRDQTSKTEGIRLKRDKYKIEYSDETDYMNNHYSQMFLKTGIVEETIKEEMEKKHPESRNLHFLMDQRLFDINGNEIEVPQDVIRSVSIKLDIPMRWVKYVANFGGDNNSFSMHGLMFDTKSSPAWDPKKESRDKYEWIHPQIKTRVMHLRWNPVTSRWQVYVTNGDVEEIDLGTFRENEKDQAVTKAYTFMRMNAHG